MSDLLTAAEADALARYEAKVEQGLASFMETGTALLHIRDERLYRATHSTFEDYLRQRWNISRKRGYDLIAGAETVMALSPIGDTPQIENEAQARAIAPIVKEHGPERAAEVLREVAASGPVTAAAITQATRPATITTRTTETTEVVDLATGEILSEDVTAEVWEAEQAVREFPALNVPGSDPADIVAMAANLRALPEDQRAWRAENGRKWLTAKVEGRIGQRRPETPDIWAPVFKAVTECIRTIRDAGGPEALVAALDGLLPIHRDNNLGQVADLAATLDDIRPQGLRRIQ